LPALLVVAICGWVFLRTGTECPVSDHPAAGSPASVAGGSRATVGAAAPAAAVEVEPDDPIAGGNKDAWTLIARQRQRDQRAVATAGEPLPADFLDRSVAGAAISFDLPDGSAARGDVQMIERDAAGIVAVQGRLTHPAAGSYFFQRQTADGKAGPMVGNVRFDDRRDSWNIEPAADLRSADAPDQHCDSAPPNRHSAAKPSRGNGRDLSGF
jgi:hypothetical protein